MATIPPVGPLMALEHAFRRDLDELAKPVMFPPEEIGEPGGKDGSQARGTAPPTGSRRLAGRAIPAAAGPLLAHAILRRGEVSVR